MWLSESQKDFSVNSFCLANELFGNVQRIIKDLEATSVALYQKCVS